MAEIVFEANLEIVCDILLAIDDEESMSDVEEFSDQSLYRVEGPGFPAIPPLEFFFKQDNQFILHS